MVPMIARLISASVLLLATTVALADDAKQDLDKLKGTWSVVSFDVGGQSMPAEMTEKVTFAFTGDKL
jgi:hypothetical protein